MTRKNIFYILLSVLTLSFTTVFIQTASSSSLNPLPPGLILSDDISDEAQKALAYVEEKEGIEIANLVVVNEFQRDSGVLRQQRCLWWPRVLPEPPRSLAGTLGA